MKQILTVLLVVLATAVAAQSQEHREPVAHNDTPRQPVASIPSGWVRYNSADGRYNVALPTQPKLSTQDSQTADGVKFLQYMATSSTDAEVCLIGYFDRVPGTTFSLDKARDGFVNAIKGTLISENNITLAGQPGLEARVEGTGSDGAQYVLRVRIYNMGTRIYVVQFIAAKADADSPIRKRNAAQYFASFTVSQ